MFSRTLVKRVFSFHKTVYLVSARSFLVTSQRRIINPLLPFDVLEELENEEVDEQNKKLLKEKKKLIRQKNIMSKKLKEEKQEKDCEDHDVKKEKSHERNLDDSQNKADSKGDMNQEKFSKENELLAKEPHKEELLFDKGDLLPTSKATIAGVEEIGVVEDTIINKSFRSHTSDVLKPQLDFSCSVGVGGVGNGNGGGRGGGDGGPPNKTENDNDEDNNKKEKETVEEEEEEYLEEEPEEPPSKLRETFEKFTRFLFKCLETIGITLSSVGVLGLSGLLYHKFYNLHVLDKMDEAFQKGDPAYQLAIHKKTNKRSDDENEEEFTKDSEDLTRFWVIRPQQQLLDDIVSGKLKGRYYLLVGEKGTGKTTLIMEAMKKIDGHNVAIFDAHADPEIFRIRLGRALNFAYNEDYIGSLFSIRGPRDTTALLDIERAFNKLEQLAILRRMSGKDDKPLIMIINNAHLIKENQDGVQLLELLQQKAESLSGSELVTMVFNSDDYWIYEKLKRLGTRLELIHVRDFNRKETVNVLQFIRHKFYPPNKYPELQFDEDTCHKIYDLIGGRPQHIGQVSRHKNALKACHEIIDREKTWFLNQCGLLGEEMDDDVMEFGKFSSSAMMLMREFVEMDRARMNTLISKALPDAKDSYKDHQLPELPLWRARQVMTRPDYIQQYDNLNIFTVDSDSRVRADSVPMMRAFHEIASQPHFDVLLDETVERVGAIESLGRTREVVMKDLNNGDSYDVLPKEGKYVLGMTKKADKDDGDEQTMLMEEISKSDHRKKWWEKRMGRFDQSYLPKNYDDVDLKP